jgi:putative tricarboxylic transport membrane protein
VFNVDGAGGTLGLSQLVSKASGDPCQLMMTGLVMLGAIETNQAQVDLGKTTPIATMTTEPEAIVVPAKSKYKTFRDLADVPQARPRVDPVGRRLGRLDRPAARRRAGGGGEANASILCGSVDAGSTGVSEVIDQVKASKMRLLAVSSPVNTKIDGQTPRTIKQEGIDLELTNWRAITAPPGISDSERARITGWVTRVMKTPKWQDTSSATTGCRSSRPAATSIGSSRANHAWCTRSSASWGSAADGVSAPEPARREGSGPAASLSHRRSASRGPARAWSASSCSRSASSP